MADIRTHYDNLKVARNAPVSVIKAAYKALCQTYHPDKFQGSNEQAERIMKIINASYAVLIDPVKRTAHDDWIREQEAKAKQQSEKIQFGEATGQQQHQRQDKHDNRKAEEPPPSTNPNKHTESVNIKNHQNWGRYDYDNRKTYTLTQSIEEFIIIFIILLGLISLLSILYSKTHEKKERAIIPYQVQRQPAKAEQNTQQITPSSNTNVENITQRAYDLVNQGRYAKPRLFLNT